MKAAANPTEAEALIIITVQGLPSEEVDHVAVVGIVTAEEELTVKRHLKRNVKGVVNTIDPHLLLAAQVLPLHQENPKD